MTLYLVISLPESPHIHRTYVVLANLYIHRCQFKSPYTVHIWFWPILYIHRCQFKSPYTVHIWFWPIYIYTAVSSNHRHCKVQDSAHQQTQLIKQNNQKLSTVSQRTAFHTICRCQWWVWRRTSPYTWRFTAKNTVYAPYIGMYRRVGHSKHTVYTPYKYLVGLSIPIYTCTSNATRIYLWYQSLNSHHSYVTTRLMLGN